ncbi:hypothetical protein DPMN_092921 [Dreissena polymorpha]|uniref:Uncharacterized protein n=1 Tax=Dreissena polymorpha TaxID=45954 RepID=A0A9D4L388_DREPO|nr:hypothetical protein DPMN_092921 [Dreissena polymorpha]
MSDEDDLGSGSELGTSPAISMSGVSKGSDLFKTVLEDYIFDETRISKTEVDRYKSRQNRSDKHDENHVKSRRCEVCQSVMAFCKCELYHERQRKFGHRVHWADEVWNKPLTTLFQELHVEDDVTSSSDVTDDPRDKSVCRKNGLAHSLPKPILKHRPTCIVIVSD